MPLGADAFRYWDVDTHALAVRPRPLRSARRRLVPRHPGEHRDPLGGSADELIPGRVDFGALLCEGGTILFSMPGTDAPPKAGPPRARAQETTPPASALGAGGVAGALAEASAAELSDAVRIRAMADGRIVAIVAIVEKVEREAG